jgi:hypothetical protein
MSNYLKSAAVVVVVVAALAIYQAIHGIAITGSGGLGAVSFGFSEAFAELVALVAVAGIFFYWRSRRRKSSRSTARR